MEADLAYYQRRSSEEVAAARLAPNLTVRQAHLDLARLYAARVGDLEAEHRRAAMHLVAPV